MGLPLTVTVLPAGGRAIDLLPKTDSARWSTAAVGGFATATFDLEGFVRLPYLALVRITDGTSIIWEGRVEDQKFTQGDSSTKTTVTCFGLQRLLSDVSVRRIWSKRDIDWQYRTRTATPQYDNAFAYTAGRYDESDLTKNGIIFKGTGNGPVVANAFGGNAIYFAPTGVTLKRVMGSHDLAGAGANWRAEWYSFGTSAFTLDSNSTASGTFSVALTRTEGVLLAMQVVNGGGYTPATTDTCAFRDIRILGTTLTEDASGGFYGGTILRDLIALVPGLSAGKIDDGSDYTIPSLERAVRTAALAVVQEVAGYYTREWAVWEDGRFDWQTRNLDQTQNLLTLPDLDSLDLTGSVDGIAKTSYVLYDNAALAIQDEASSSSTDRRNPYVLQSVSKDDLSAPGFPMTSLSSAQLASRLIQDRGGWVPASGQLTLPVEKMVQSAVGPARPAALIRAGENVTIVDLPKDDILAPEGRDGQTLFHISAAETDLRAGLVTWTVEAQATRADVLLARLAAVTRVLTG